MRNVRKRWIFLPLEKNARANAQRLNHDLNSVYKPWLSCDFTAWNLTCRPVWRLETAGHNTWYKKFGADTQDQVSFSIFIFSLTWDKEAGVCSPTFFTTTTLCASLREHSSSKFNLPWKIIMKNQDWLDESAYSSSYYQAIPTYLLKQRIITIGKIGKISVIVQWTIPIIQVPL